MGGVQDRQAWLEGLWREHASSLNRLLLSYEADRSLREDLAQNIFLALLQSLERVRGADNPKAYLFRIAHNVATDHVAREVRRAWTPLEDDLAASLPDTAPSPDEQIEHNESSTRLMQAVRHLRLPLRQVVTLLLEDFGHDEIADILGISAGNVRVRLNRARQQLEELMQ